ncbi:MAG: tetratricopeptide repeat protein [Promethearchaeota archaeon]
MAKKSSIEKKLRPLVKESEALSSKKQYTEAIRKLREGLSLVRDKIKDSDEQKQELENLKEKINDIYILEINKIINAAEHLKEEEAIEAYNKAMTVSINISDDPLRDTQANKIEKLKSIARIGTQINKAIESFKEKQFDKNLKILEKALEDASKICDPEDATIIKIKQVTNEVYSEKINLIFTQGDELKEKGQIEDAIKKYNEALEITDLMYDNDLKASNINKSKEKINRSYADIIDTIVSNRKEFLSENKVEEASQQVQIIIEILDKMHDTDFKRNKMDELSELINPTYVEKIKAIIEAGQEITSKNDFENSIQDVSKALRQFQEALEIAKKMIKSEVKEQKVKNITSIINETCKTSIAPRKTTGIKLIEERKFEEAIRELYSVMSIAKNIIYPEGQENEEIEEIKNTINEVYAAQVEDILKIGDQQIIQKNYIKALDTFNDALGITNKMYLSEETEALVNKIKNIVYETELKQVVQKGDISEEDQKFLKEIESLQQSLQVAKDVKDPDLKAKEMERLGREIDLVHGNRIKLLIEQAIELASKNQFDPAYELFEKAITVSDLIELREIKNRELNNIIENYTQELNNKAKQNIGNNKHDDAIDLCKKAIELDENNSVSYYIMGLAHAVKSEQDKAINNFQKAIDLNSNFAEAWNDKGLVHIAKSEFDQAINCFNNAVGIDQNHSDAWYNMGNTYKLKKEFNKSIESYDKAIEADEAHAKAFLFKGSVYFDTKEYYKALENLTKAIELDNELGKNISKKIKEIKESFDSIGDHLKIAFNNR